MSESTRARPGAAPTAVVAPLAGSATFLLTLAATQDSYDSVSWLVSGAAAVVTTGVAAAVAWRATQSVPTRRPAASALALAVLGALTFPVFYLGALQVFGLTAAAIALTAVLPRRRDGMALAAAVLGTLDVLAGTLLLATG